MVCPTISVFRLMGEKWAFVVLEGLSMQKFGGFNKFSKKSGITPKVLSRALKDMEASGFVEKRDSAYKLTPKIKNLSKSPPF